jgi:two-component system, sensor histidine kinase YesM
MNERRKVIPWSEFFTLKHRIFLIFTVSSILMFLGIGLVSYFAITSILTNKINAGVQSNLIQIQLALLNNLSNLNHVSQQFDDQGVIGLNLNQFLQSHEPYEQAQLMTKMKEDLNNITFSNPGIGLVMYYFEKDHTFMLENSGLKANFDPTTLPLIASYYKIAYYGPHVSWDKYNDQYVLSALRKVNLAGRDDTYVYIETGFKLTQTILDTDRTGVMAFHLMLDNDGRIAYSEVPNAFPLNTQFGGGGNNKILAGFLNNYYWFKVVSNQGWSVVSVIPSAEYNREKNLWISRMLFLLIVFFVINLFLTLLLWDFVYRPLGKFEKEIKWIENGNFNVEMTFTRIPEFDDLLRKFQQMKKQILDLIREVEYKEKRRADLEIEKLLYQINPHFLMNTLDTAHWMAVMNDQTEIDRIVQTLNKLLSYNLGKKGRMTTIADEIDALKQYLFLQQVRHEFDFDIQVKAGAETMSLSIPRFILQPIVENAIYHGISKHGLITVTVELKDRIEISIKDNGAGMTDEKVRELLNKEQVEQEKVGMGIGMNYVKRILESYYAGQAELCIESKPGEGTLVTLSLPVSMEAH